MAPSTTTTELITETRAEFKGSEPKKLPTYEEIRKAIPAHCFEKSIPTSVYYLIQDYVIIAGLYYIVPYVEYYASWPGLLLWYWFMGMFMSSLFCVGHDAGHGTFSEYKWVNDIFGHLAHAPIMAPFWPWQKSHRLHHTYTSHLEKDKGHPWVTEEDHMSRGWFVQNFAKFPLSGLFRWNPIYTFVGLPDGSHFWPFSKLFTNNTERIQCAVSASLCAICAYAAFVLCDYSVYNFIKYYYVPLLFQGLWMVMITYLQHQDEEIEVYEEGTWNFVMGQSQTIDRTYGFGMDKMLHHITDGHVAHHFFFTKIPHYHLPEATVAIQKVLAPYKNIYKKRSCYDFLLEFLRLNMKLEYLLGKGTGLLMYGVSSKYQNLRKSKAA
uniref:Delta-12 fatty acid desaturase n=1 Tax=Cephalobus sp. DWF1301 TaxID=2584826 RepID=A0A4Y5R3N1_9BILA|nr:delta-12 fatty acid desaturase [Cephalobus sp. DWF1301]